MIYRAEDQNQDYTIGAFLINSPEAVAQAIRTRLNLWKGEWFLDTTDGTPWLQEILGKRQSGRNPDAVIKQRILQTQGVKELASYSSNFEPITRQLTVNATVNTIYGQTSISETL